MQSRSTHDYYLDLIYSHSIIPTILKPTRITKTSTTIIDNIITNSDDSLKTAILITDISDHLPSILMTRLKTGNNSEKSESPKENKFVYKRKLTEENITKFKQRLSKVKWSEVLHGIDSNNDYFTFVDVNNKLYNECIPLRKSSENRRKVPQSPWITKGLVWKVSKIRTNCAGIFTES